MINLMPIEPHRWHLGRVFQSTGRRWLIADILNRSDRYCWADLVAYVLSWAPQADPLERRYLFSMNEETGIDPVIKGDAYNVGQCRLSTLEQGNCYCGKFSSRRVANAEQFRAGFVVEEAP